MKRILTLMVLMLTLAIIFAAMVTPALAKPSDPPPTHTPRPTATAAPTEVGSTGDEHGQPGDPGNNNASGEGCLHGEPDCDTPTPTEVIVEPTATATPTAVPTDEPTATLVPTDAETPVATPTAEPVECVRVVCGWMWTLEGPSGQVVQFASFSPRPDGGWYPPETWAQLRCLGWVAVNIPRGRPIYDGEVLTHCVGGGCASTGG